MTHFTNQGLPSHEYRPQPLAPRYRRKVPRRHYRPDQPGRRGNLPPSDPQARQEIKNIKCMDVALTVLRSGLLDLGTTRTLQTVVTCPETKPIHFMDVALQVLRSGMIDDSDLQTLQQVSNVFRPSSWYLLPSWIYRPGIPFRKRKYGFGAAEVGKSTVHETPNPLGILHHVWNYLEIPDKQVAVKTHVSWWKYAKLRSDAATTSLSSLQIPRPRMRDEELPTELDPQRAQLNSCALLRFDFLHGDFIRWLGGEYTNAGRNFDQEWVKILEALDGIPPKECPPVSPIQAFRAQTGGVPLKADYVTPYQVPAIRDKYDNHPAVAENADKVHKKFAKEEWKAYHIHYHRWLYPFITGLIIAPIQWAFDKGKGRICIDCSNGPPDKSGSVNSFIPKPFNAKKPPKDMILDADACPPTYFKYAFKRVIRRILRMRRSRPKEPILGHADDIDAAFRRILYHPDMAQAFAYFFQDYLLIPVSQVFGGRSCPPYYGLLADVRELLATVRPVDKEEDFHPLLKQSNFKIDTTTPLATIPEDDYHPQLTEEELQLPFQASYVDDTATLAFRDKILAAVNNSVKAAFMVFGEGGKDRRGDCLQMAKWETDMAEEFRFLGFDINTHNMTITWPFYKRKALHDEIMEILARENHGKSGGRFVTPKEMAHLVGVVRSASEVAPWGTFLSFNLQNALNAAQRNARKPSRRWYNKHKIYLSRTAIATLRQLAETLLCEDGCTWTRPMALYFDRTPTHRVYSDASYIGIGGWSPDFDFLWRITRQDLHDLGFPMKEVNCESSEPIDGKSPGLHINPLEFVAAIINLWISLILIKDAGPREGGYVLQLNSDNTTALAWMSEASRTPDPYLQGLARIEHRSRRIKPTKRRQRRKCRIIGLRYRGMAEFADVSDLPTPFRIASANCRRAFIEKDRGTVRRANDRTFDSQGQEFVSWCQDMGFSEHDIQVLTDAQCIEVLGTYVHEVGRGRNLQRRKDLSSQTLRNYVKAAHRVLEIWLGRSIPIYDKNSFGKQQRFHEYIGQQFRDRRNWSRKRPQKLHLTRDIYKALADHLLTYADSLDAFLGDKYSVYDWLRLGVFTGFRIAEFAQARVPRGAQFLTVPYSDDVPEDQQGKPLAFTADDITFYDRKLRLIPHNKLMAKHRRGQVRYVQLRWRFDKSANNFVIRRYTTTDDPIFNPVDAAVNIIYRAQLLGIPRNEPVGAWRNPKGKKAYRFLRDSTVSAVMRQSTVWAYPDPNHFYRINIKSIVPHGIRVSAAVAMKMGGAGNDEIAHSKRWHLTSVPVYLRDGFESAHLAQEMTLKGLNIKN